MWWSSGPTEQSNLKLTNQNKKKQPNNNNTTITRIVESRWSEISEEFNAFSFSLSLSGLMMEKVRDIYENEFLDQICLRISNLVIIELFMFFS